MKRYSLYSPHEVEEKQLTYHHFWIEALFFAMFYRHGYSEIEKEVD